MDDNCRADLEHPRQSTNSRVWPLDLWTGVTKRLTNAKQHMAKGTQSPAMERWQMGMCAMLVGRQATHIPGWCTLVSCVSPQQLFVTRELANVNVVNVLPPADLLLDLT